MRTLLLTCLLCSTSFPLLADETPKWPPSYGHTVTIGRTDSGDPLQAWFSPGSLNPLDGKARIAAVVDVGAHQDEFDALLQHVAKSAAEQQNQFVHTAIVFVPPNAVPEVTSADRLLSFPPKGSAYNTAGERTAATIWRFLAWFGPDLIIDVHSKHLAEFQATLSGGNDEARAWSPDSLGAAASNQSIAGFGKVSVLRIPSSLALGTQKGTPEVHKYAGLNDTNWLQTFADGSPLKREVKQRLQRSPSEVVDQLLAVYGGDLNTVMYQPALAVIARLETARQRGDDEKMQQVAAILKPYLDGKKEALPGNANGSLFAGHLVFADWVRESGDSKAVALVRNVAERGFDKNGNPLPAMPSHSEMSDAVFMSCPILVAAAELTGEQKYLDMAQRHLKFMQKLCLRPDGLYRHSPLCEAAWGRGNGFPALGLALSLTDLDRMLVKPDLAANLREKATEVREEMRQSLEAHLTALLPHQDLTGMWQQVIDEPVSYREMTSTCMIGFALSRGVQRGWLTDPKFTAAADKAWEAVKLRTGSGGELLDVCTGTGKQKSLEDYYNRTAILGKDERGGAMVLMFAVERARAEKAPSSHSSSQ